MRKLSQDGGDNTSITSSIENEIKKSGPGILKSTKNSIKKKVQNLSNESDDTVNEPLLHKSKEKSEIEKQSAKMLLSKTKTDFVSAKDKDNLLAHDRIPKPSVTDLTGITLSAASNHNHMNTNVFNTSNGIKNTITAKTQILVEVDTSKPSGYSQSPLIFTTAKIHTDGKIKQMEPVQVTPVPILSTIEGGIVKSGNNVKEFDKSKDEVISPVSRVTSVSNACKTLDKKLNVSLKKSDTANVSLKCSQNKDNVNKIKESTPFCTTTSQISNTSKNPTEESVRSKNAVPTKPIKEDTEYPIKIQVSQQVSNLNDMSNSAKKDYTKTDPLHNNSATNKSYVDMNKNVDGTPEPKTVAKKTSENKEAEQRLTPQPSSNISSLKHSSSSSKEVKTATCFVKKLKDTRSGNSQDGKITTSMVKSPVKEPEKNIVKIINKTKPATVNNAVNNAERSILNTSLTEKSMPNTTASIPLNTSSTIKSTENRTCTTLIPMKSKLSTTAISSEFRSPVQENADSTKTSSTAKPTGINKIHTVNTVNSPEVSTSTLPILPLASVVSDTTSIHDKIVMAATGKETIIQDKTLYTSVLSASTSINSAVSSASASPQATLCTTVDNIPVTINTKTIASSQTSDPSRTSITSNITADNIKLSSNISSTTASHVDLKPKSNNVATVVSSISKTINTPSDTKSSPSSSTIMMKSIPTTTHLTSPSTVKTISSVHSAKSAVVSSVPRDKKSTKGMSAPVTKPSSSISKSSTTTKKPMAVTGTTSKVVVAPSANATATTSAKSAIDSSLKSGVKHREDAKYSSKNPKTINKN